MRKYIEEALKNLRIIVKQNGFEVVKDSKNPVWDEFVEMMIESCGTKPTIENVSLDSTNKNSQTKPTKIDYRVLGYNLFAKRMLKLPDSLTWRRTVLGEALTQEEVFWIVVEQLAPSVLWELEEETLEIAKCRNNTMKIISRDLAENFSGELLAKAHELYLCATKLLRSRKPIPTALLTLDDIAETSYKLSTAYRRNLANWCNKYNLIGEDKTVLNWCIEKAHSIIRSCMDTEKKDEDLELLLSSVPNKNTIDFVFEHRGWNPNQSPFLNKREARESITKDFEKYLEQYLTKQEPYLATKQAKTQKRDLHIIWLVRNRLLRESADEFVNEYKQPDGSPYDRSSIYKGIDKATRILGFTKKRPIYTKVKNTDLSKPLGVDPIFTE